MCCKTKRLIAQTLIELMQERPLKKITVQDIMDSAHMTRQSFYYHFQDVYDVLEWEVDRRLFVPLAFDPAQDYEDWNLEVLRLLREDGDFYRKVLAAISGEEVVRQCEKVLVPQICRRLLGEPYPDMDALSDDEKYRVHFYTRAICNEFCYLVRSRSVPDPETCRSRVRLMCAPTAQYVWLAPAACAQQ